MVESLVSQLLRAETYMGLTPLHVGAEKGHGATIRALLAAGDHHGPHAAAAAAQLHATDHSGR